MSAALDSLDAQTTVVTVNQRLARALGDAFDRSRVERGERVWPSADIVPYATWVQRAWHEVAERAALDVPAMLSSQQESTLWEQVIRDYATRDRERALLHVRSAARHAQAAWALLRNWRLALRDIPDPLTEDVRVFARWANAFQTRLRDEGWVEPAGIVDQLIPHVRGDARWLPRRWLAAGFDRLAPVDDALRAALTEGGVEVGMWAPPSHAGAARRMSFPSREVELETVARWARRRLEDGANGTIGVVVPRLEEYRDQVERVFEDVLHPASVSHWGETRPRAFNVSLGRALGTIPLARDALRSLRLLENRLSLAEVSAWLRSPYVAGGVHEHGARALLDASLRDAGELRATRVRLIAAASRLSARETKARAPERALGVGVAEAGGRYATAAPRLTDRLNQIEQFTRGLPRRQSVERWARTFAQALGLVGWPGDRALDSTEFQLVEAFHELLGAFAGLAPVLTDQSLSQALARLEHLAAERVFQPRTGPAPVQILGVLESTGLEYDALWITGLHDRVWPEPARPNPFLPVALQRRLAMPHAGADHELEFARRITTRLLGSAPEVIVSHAERDGDENLCPSPLVVELPYESTSAIALSRIDTSLATVRRAAPSLEVVDERDAPRFATTQAAPGGARLIRDQAACPFRAFAVHRLNAVDVRMPVVSLDARVRGVLVHRLLERMWREIKSQARLASMSDATLTADLERVASALLREERRIRPEILSGRFFELELRRLTALGRMWLALERDRSPFEVVAPERRLDAELGGLRIQVRPDRIDRVDNGGYLLIDYKTGSASPSGWFGKRLDEPQLPLYALALNGSAAIDGGEVRGTAFGVVRRGALAFRGIAADPDVAEGIELPSRSRPMKAHGLEEWRALLGHWRHSLQGLAEQFIDGEASVDPKRGEQTCRLCRLQAFCRISERRAEAPREDPV